MGPDFARTVGLVLLAYLAGSIPVGSIVAQLVGGPDLRSIGSGRTGGTNALRALGRKWAVVVVIGDLLKGALPVLLARIVTGDPLVEVLCGGAAVAGAIWSVFVGFRSGRGVGTGVGTMLVIQPIAVLLATPVFVVAILLTRYVSLGSLLGSAAMIPAMLLVLLLVPGDTAAVCHLHGGRDGVHLARPRRQHRPPAARHRAKVRPGLAGRETVERRLTRRPEPLPARPRGVAGDRGRRSKLPDGRGTPCSGNRSTRVG